MKKLLNYAWWTGLTLAMPIVANAAEESHDGHAGGDHAHVDGDPMALMTLEMIWAVVLFILFAAILGFVVWPKILGALQAREQKLEGDLVGAESARKEADAALAEYKAKIAEAQQEARRVVDEARSAAEKAAASIKAETESDIAKMRDRASAEIASAKEQALGDIYAQTAELSTLIAGKILKREINAQDQQQLVQDSLAELTNAGV